MRIPGRSMVLCGVIGLAAGGWPASLPAAEPGESFATILRTGTQATFDRVAGYLKQNPDAADAGRAWQWLFQTALEQGFEVEALELSQEFLSKTGQDPVALELARQSRTLGLARSRRGDEAVTLFQQQLKSARLQSGGAQIEFGKRLAAHLQVGRDFAAARQVYDDISGRFFLNTDVRSLCEARTARIDLIDKPAPAVSATDIAGQPLSLEAFRGRAVLLDFWATNCPPCLEEMPNLRQLHAEHHDQGFDIVGISLDGDASVVTAYAQQAGLPWRMVVNEPEVERLRAAYHVRTIPALVLVNRAGEVHQVDVRGDHLRDSVRELMK